MNKVFIVLLAVCLVSVHAFSKRDAPEAPKGSIQDIAAQLQKIQEEMGKKVAASLNPEEFKKGMESIMNNINNAINELKGASPSPK